MQKYSKIDNPEIIESLFNLSAKWTRSALEYAEDLEFTTADETVLVCRLFLAGKTAPTVLFFHDSMESTEKYDVIGSKYLEYGINVLFTCYRGMGRNSGEPGILCMMEDAELLLHETLHLVKQKNIEGPLFVMGKSLGSACAIDIAYNHADSLKGLIIESGFCDTLPFLEEVGVDISKMQLLEEDGFNNRGKIEKIKLPTLILHGSIDTLVPPAHAEILQATSGARTKQFHLIPGADRETMIATGGDLYFKTIKTFIDTVSGVNTWRQRRRKYKK